MQAAALAIEPNGSAQGVIRETAYAAAHANMDHTAEHTVPLRVPLPRANFAALPHESAGLRVAADSSSIWVRGRFFGMIEGTHELEPCHAARR